MGEAITAVGGYFEDRPHGGMGGGVLKGQCNEILKEYFLMNFFFCPVLIILLKVLPSWYILWSVKSMRAKNSTSMLFTYDGDVILCKFCDQIVILVVDTCQKNKISIFLRKNFMTQPASLTPVFTVSVLNLAGLGLSPLRL
jgi:hypothetical protein